MSSIAFDRLVDQIDLFIRKYYKNQLINGLIWFVGILVGTFILVATLEYFGRFSTPVRAVLFFSFLLINCGIFIKYFIVPLSKLYAFGSRINRFQASEIIGDFFPGISDRLLNTLQLEADLTHQTGNIELLRASVAQRSESLSAVPFSSAIDVRENLKYIKWFAPLFVLFLGIAIVKPALFKEGSNRVVNYGTYFPPVAPFEFKLVNFVDKVVEGEDMPIKLKLVGEDIPQKVYLVSSQGKQLMNISGRNEFTSSINKVPKNGHFYFIADEYTSADFNYEVYGRPVIGQFKAEIVYPKYLGKSNEIVSNAGDMLLPEGTSVVWNVFAKNTSLTKLKIGEELSTFKNEGFRFSKIFKNSTPISLLMKGSQMNVVDSVSFNVNIIKDAHPTILVEESIDSVATGVRVFKGNISDDYGLTGLKFVYNIIGANGSKRTETISVKSVSGIEAPFDFAVDFMRENIQLEDKIEYFFVVYDNDGVNGSKSTRSKLFTYKVPSLDELNDKRELVQEKNKENLNNLLERSMEIQKNLERLQRDLLNSKSSDWKQKNQLNQLQNEYNDLLKEVEKSNQELQKSAEEKMQLSKEDEAFMEKQKMLEELMQQLMDDELRKLLDDLEKLMQDNNKESQQKKFDELKLSSEQMNKRLDRSIEMLKKMQVDEKIDAIEDELSKLAKEQVDLKKALEEKKLSKEDVLKEQNDINEKFDQLKDDLKKLDELNDELIRPMDLPSFDELKNEIDSDLKDSKDNISKGKESKAGQSQKSAAEKMQQMSEQLDKAQNDSNQQQQGEDMEMLREILESLITLSLDQEKVMNNFQRIKQDDPSYRSFSRTQRTIVDNTKPVSDSLYELARRQPMLSKFVDEELKGIHINQKKSLEEIENRRVRFIASHQQLAMTSYNNLALMLNESLQQMQKQMQAQSESSGSCSSPGSGKPKPGAGESMGNMKEQIKKQLEQMKKGSNPGGKDPGNSEGGDVPSNKPGSQGSFGLGNKEVAKMAAEQSAIRQKLEELKKELNKEGKGEGNQLDPLLKELEQQEKDLVNKRFSPEMIRRQQDILTRLLESEKALRERGLEEKRESKDGKNQINSNLIRFDEYNKEKLKQVELLRTIDPVYNKYYKDKASQFFNGVNH